MNEIVQPWLNIAMLAVPIALMVIITVGCTTVFVRAIRASDPDSGPVGFAYQAMLFNVMMLVFLLAGMGIAKFLDMVIQGWGAIVGVVVTLFGGWLTYKGVITVKNADVGEIVATPTPPESGGV